MGDAGEGLIDQDSRIQERMDEVARERAQGRADAPRDPEQVRALESLRLARTELEGQLAATTHDRRRAQIGDAIAEIDRRVAAAVAETTGRGPARKNIKKK
jgi:hypothetical protein